MIGHLGTRVSALLDDQLSPQEAERAWTHVHTCHFCRDLVERQGWVKTRLATMSQDRGSAPEDLKGSLMGMPAPYVGMPVELPMRSSVEAYAAITSGPSRRVTLGFATIGGGAVGAAVMGVLALGAAPADAPAEPRPPASRIVTPATPTGGPVSTPVRELRP